MAIFFYVDDHTALYIFHRKCDKCSRPPSFHPNRDVVPHQRILRSRVLEPQPSPPPTRSIPAPSNPSLCSHRPRTFQQRDSRKSNIPQNKTVRHLHNGSPFLIRTCSHKRPCGAVSLCFSRALIQSRRWIAPRGGIGCGARLVRRGRTEFG
jgi:hypothetical protein